MTFWRRIFLERLRILLHRLAGIKNLPADCFLLCEIFSLTHLNAAELMIVSNQLYLVKLKEERFWPNSAFSQNIRNNLCSKCYLFIFGKTAALCLWAEPSECQEPFWSNFKDSFFFFFDGIYNISYHLKVTLLRGTPSSRTADCELRHYLSEEHLIFQRPEDHCGLSRGAACSPSSR